jgi:hypothetical protein
MSHVVVALDCRSIRDRETFHSVFAEAMGFPDFYGRNMDAWIDCFTNVDDPSNGLTTIVAPVGGVLVLKLENVQDFRTRCADLYADIIECSAFVNWRRMERGASPVLALSFAE